MEEKRYYYLKLDENFFDDEAIKLIESMENGYLYSNILLKLYLKALKNNGKLIFNEFIPYDVKMIATITGHNIDVVDKAIKIFQGLGLIEILDNGAIYMLNIQKMIGSISSEGIRKAEYREKIRLEKENGTKLGQCPDIISNYSYISYSNSNTNSYLNSTKEEEITEKKLNKEKSNKEKEKYQEIFDYWNANDIKHHRQLTANMENVFKRVLKEYTIGDIKTAISHYATIYHDKGYFWHYQWDLVDFLKQKNALPNFLDEGSTWLNYLQKTAKNQNVVEQAYNEYKEKESGIEEIFI